MEAIEKETRELLCVSAPYLDMCKDFKAAKTNNKTIRDKDLSTQISGLDSVSSNGNKVNFDTGDNWKTVFGLSTDPSEAEAFIIEYYNRIKNGIIDTEAEALLDIQVKRDNLKSDFETKNEEYELLAAGATSIATKEGFLKKQLALSKKYASEDAKLEKQSVDIKTSSAKAKTDVDKLYRDNQMKLQGEAAAFAAAETNKELDLLKKIEDEKNRIKQQAMSALADAYNSYQQEMLSNTLNAISAELEAVEARKVVENDILKSQLDNNIITAEAYEKKRVALEKKEIEEKNRLNKAAFDAQKNADISAAISSGLAAAAQAYVQSIAATAPVTPAGIALGAASAGIIALKTAAEVNAISNRRFAPVRYAEGGVVEGRSHSDGGVPFSVSGVGGYEMEGGEYLVNKSSTAKYKPLLDAINGKNVPYGDNKFFANGGQVQDVRMINQDVKESVIRAYITKRDLRDYAKSEERINKISKL